MGAKRIRQLLGVVLAGLCIVGVVVFWLRRPEPEPMLVATPTATVEPTPAPIQIHVVGAVRTPGVYALLPGSRIVDAVEAAGGFTQDADAERVNLADFLQDGEQLRIPQVGLELPASPTPLSSASRMEGGLVNLNTASVAELEALPGIGPTYAERIVSYREEHGPFESCEQVKDVRGIGEVCYEQIVPHITIE